MARPTKLTPALHKKIIKMVRDGVAPMTAAINAGLGERTYFDWMEWGKEGREPYSQFAQDIYQAKESVRAAAESCVKKAFTGIKEKKVRKKLEKCKDTGRMIIVEEVRETVEKIYPQFAVQWLERQARDDWSPPKAKEEVEPGPDSVTAGPTYTDPWMPPSEGDDGDD